MEQQAVDLKRAGALAQLNFQLLLTPQAREIRDLMSSGVNLSTVQRLYPFDFCDGLEQVTDALRIHQTGREILDLLNKTIQGTPVSLFDNKDVYPFIERAENAWNASGHRQLLDVIEPIYTEAWAAYSSKEDVLNDLDQMVWDMVDIFIQMPYLELMSENMREERLELAEQILQLLDWRNLD